MPTGTHIPLVRQVTRLGDRVVQGLASIQFDVNRLPDSRCSGSK
jgi:hypothetical protein